MAREVNLRRDRFLFYTGLVLLLMGGPGLAMGSLLHDSLRVPVVGTAFGAFGWINQTFAAVGAVATIVGLAFLGISLKGGVLTEDELAELSAGRSRS